MEFCLTRKIVNCENISLLKIDTATELALLKIYYKCQCEVLIMYPAVLKRVVDNRVEYQNVEMAHFPHGLRYANA